MPPPEEVVAAWHDFYLLLGTASGTLIGLLFVAASVSTGTFSADRRAPLRIFLSASVVNFSLILAVSLMGLTPTTSWPRFGGVVVGCGLFGLAHSCLAWRDTLREGLIANIDMEDRVWYIAFPVAGYLLVMTAGSVLALHHDVGRPMLAAATGLLLATGIHNAWDITVWIITRRRE